MSQSKDQSKCWHTCKHFYSDEWIITICVLYDFSCSFICRLRGPNLFHGIPSSHDRHQYVLQALYSCLYQRRTTLIFMMLQSDFKYLFCMLRWLQRSSQQWCCSAFGCDGDGGTVPPQPTAPHVHISYSSCYCSSSQSSSCSLHIVGPLQCAFSIVTNGVYALDQQIPIHLRSLYRVLLNNFILFHTLDDDNFLNW